MTLTSLHCSLPGLVQRVFGVGYPRLCSDNHVDLELIGTLPPLKHGVQVIRYLGQTDTV